MEDLIGNLIPILIVIMVLWSLFGRATRRRQGSSGHPRQQQAPERHPQESIESRVARAREEARHRLERIREAARRQGSEVVEGGTQQPVMAQVPPPPEELDRSVAGELEVLLSGEETPSEEQPRVVQPAAETVEALPRQHDAPSLEEEGAAQGAPRATVRERRPSRRGGVSRLRSFSTPSGLRQAVLAQVVLQRPMGLRPLEEDDHP